VIRIGVRLLFYYLVLAVGVQLANQWAAAILAACKPVSEAVPLIYSYYVPPTKIMTSVCSGFIPISAMLNYAALALVFTAMTIGIPDTVSSLVGGSIGLALAHAFEAANIARTITNPITSAISSGYKKLSDNIRSGESGKEGGSVEQAMQTILAQHQRQTSTDNAANAATKVLNPFDGRPPGYNCRPPNGSNPQGPRLPPSPKSGSGGGAALEDHPGRPGNYTRDIAVDVTGLQNGKGNTTS
jgi:hypothetical protein